MKWLLTVAFRWRPSITDWQFKTVVSANAPEEWLADRLQTARLGRYGSLDACVIYAREITDEAASALEDVLSEPEGEIRT